MKKSLLFTFVLVVGSMATKISAQNIYIPDSNFKNHLIAIGVDKNGDGEIDQIEAMDLQGLSISDKNISDLTGINFFTNLQSIHCSNNKLTNLDISKLSKLTNLSCRFNELTTLDVDSLPLLEVLDCSNNQLTTLNLANNHNLYNLQCNYNQISILDIQHLSKLRFLGCRNNQITVLDVSQLYQLEDITCNYNKITKLDLSNLTKIDDIYCDNNQINILDLRRSSNLFYLSCFNNPITSLFLKNNTDIPTYYNIFNSVPHLKYICIDAGEINKLTILARDAGYTDVVINSTCSDNSTGNFHTFNGQVKLDQNKDGCDSLDSPFPNLRISFYNQNDSGVIITGTDGNFSTQLYDISYILKPILDYSNYFSVNPTSIVFALPSPSTPTFCITPKGDFNDLAVNIIPVKAARPGFSDATYKLVYKNQGTTTQSGSATFSFDGDRTKVISSVPTADLSATGQLTFDFDNLAPFESRSVLITMHTNAPADIPAVHVGDVLEFSAEITAQTDETPEDNIATLHQTVVGSFDPNDKTCLEGDIISPDLVGKPIHYLIRFENTGTAPAENVVVTDYIDTTILDVNTLLITDASHECHTQISKGNKVQFIFNDIQLPFTEPNKHGYVAFSIQLKDHLQIGDSIKNQADIYFDYNLPITTNEAASEINIRTVTSVKQRIGNISLSVYPNPSKGDFSVELNSASLSPVQISVMDISGKIVFAKQYAASQNLIPLQLGSLAKGVYLIRAEVDSESVTKKVMVQ